MITISSIKWCCALSEEELVTPPVDDGLILPGVTRDSLLSLARSWNEFKVSERYVTMKEIRNAVKEKKVSVDNVDKTSEYNKFSSVKDTSTCLINRNGHGL